MPLTAKGEKILSQMREQYGEEKGKQVFYASANKGTITGVDQGSPTAESSGSAGTGFGETETGAGGIGQTPGHGGGQTPTTADAYPTAMTVDQIKNWKKP
jgi:hypothetical protein